MLPRRRRRTSGPASVLSVGTDRVEWCGEAPKGGALYGSHAVEEETPAGVARAALSAIEAAGDRPRPCVLALGRGLVEQRLLSLPELARGEARKVLPRKAAKLLGCEPTDALYAARRMPAPRGAQGPQGSAEGAWLLAAMRRSVSSELRLELRRLKVPIRRTVSGRLARLSRAQGIIGEGSEDGEAALVVDIEHDAVRVGVLAGPSLVSQSSLAGDFDETPSMALALIQEIRNLQAYWRKASRGGSVSRVVIIGLHPDRGRLLETAVENALPESEVILLPGEGEEPQVGRIESLRACRAKGAFDLDLSVQLPRRRATTAALALAVLGMTASGGVVLNRHMADQLGALQREGARVAADAGALADLQERQGHAQTTVDSLGWEVERTLAVAQLGVPMGEMIGEILEVFGPDAALLSLSVAGTSDPPDVNLSGVTHAHPMAAWSALDRIQRQLEEGRHLEGIQVDSPSFAAGTIDEPDPPLKFSLRALVEVSP